MLTEAIIKFIFNQKFARYGRMLKLNIDTKSKSFTIEVHPKGETSPIHITIGSYEILTGEKGGIKLNDISTSREWMTELIQALYPSPVIEVPHAKLLNLIL